MSCDGVHIFESINISGIGCDWSVCGLGLYFGIGGLIFVGVGSVDIGIGGTLFGVVSIGIVGFIGFGFIGFGFIGFGFIGFGCGLFVIGLILSKISFILNCGDSGKYEGFIGCLFGYSNVGTITDGLNIIGGCCGCCFLFLSFFSFECVLLPILTFTIWCCSWCCLILGLPLFFFSFIGFSLWCLFLTLFFVSLLDIIDILIFLYDLFVNLVELEE